MATAIDGPGGDIASTPSEKTKTGAAPFNMLVADAPADPRGCPKVLEDRRIDGFHTSGIASTPAAKTGASPICVADIAPATATTDSAPVVADSCIAEEAMGPWGPT